MAITSEHLSSGALRAFGASQPREEAGGEGHGLGNLRWLVRMRWLAVLAQAGLVLVLPLVSGLELPRWPLLGVVGGTALSNVGLALWLRRKPAVAEWMLAAVMALDFALLTALLHLSGGPSNPFTVLFLVHIALAAVVLAPGYAWMLACLACACFFALFVVPAYGGPVEAALSMHAHHHHGGGGDDTGMSLHLRGMWLAFAVAACAIAYFVTRVTKDLETQRTLAHEALTRALRSEKLASLATLAAGAAHELSTPLATIAIVAKELERDVARALGEGHGSVGDARMIREEVERCKHILTQLASDAGESAGEPFSDTSIEGLCVRALDGVADAARVRLALPDLHVLMPVRAFAGALRGLIRNALQASTDTVDVRASLRGRAVWLEIEDHGSGMAPDVLARVGEPFFTTKETGRGMGLGVFIARALAERLGGALELSSELGKGTRVRVVLPQSRDAANHLRSAP
jgi:two-component system sensor histidine kinase RegB